LDVRENIEFPLLIDPKSSGREKAHEREEWLEYLISEVGLEEWRVHKPNELSGGQRQRAKGEKSIVFRIEILLPV
jgi:putative ABC transport system ATP-binding protein